MYGMLEMMIVSFAIGLTGTLTPGPVLVATINSSFRGGWLMGPKVTAGHAILELGIFLMIVLGISVAMDNYASFIALVGGTALILFGLLTLLDSRNASISGSVGEVTANPYLAGILTSAANPYFWIWWFSIGSALVLEGLSGGPLLVLFFLVGHWSADFGWYTLVSTSFSKGKSILSEGSYRVVVALCGMFLIFFGLYYLAIL